MKIKHQNITRTIYINCFLIFFIFSCDFKKDDQYNQISKGYSISNENITKFGINKNLMYLNVKEKNSNIAFILEFTENKDIIFKKKLEDTYSISINNLCKLTNNKIIVIGSIDSEKNLLDSYFLLLEPNGDLILSEKLSSIISEFSSDVQCLGNYGYITGKIYYGIFKIKIDGLNNKIIDFNVYEGDYQSQSKITMCNDHQNFILSILGKNTKKEPYDNILKIIKSDPYEIKWIKEFSLERKYDINFIIEHPTSNDTFLGLTNKNIYQKDESFLLKFNSIGELEWVYSYDQILPQVFTYGEIYNESSLILLGKTVYLDEVGTLVFTIDLDGNIIWSEEFIIGSEGIGIYLNNTNSCINIYAHNIKENKIIVFDIYKNGHTNLDCIDHHSRPLSITDKKHLFSEENSTFSKLVEVRYKFIETFSSIIISNVEDMEIERYNNFTCLYNNTIDDITILNNTNISMSNYSRTNSPLIHTSILNNTTNNYSNYITTNTYQSNTTLKHNVDIINGISNSHIFIILTIVTPVVFLIGLLIFCISCFYKKPKNNNIIISKPNNKTGNYDFINKTQKKYMNKPESRSIVEVDYNDRKNQKYNMKYLSSDYGDNSDISKAKIINSNRKNILDNILPPTSNEQENIYENNIEIPKLNINKSYEKENFDINNINNSYNDGKNISNKEIDAASSISSLSQSKNIDENEDENINFKSKPYYNKETNDDIQKVIDLINQNIDSNLSDSHSKEEKEDILYKDSGEISEKKYKYIEQIVNNNNNNNNIKYHKESDEISLLNKQPNKYDKKKIVEQNIKYKKNESDSENKFSKIKNLFRFNRNKNSIALPDSQKTIEEEDGEKYYV